jgi:hypothetical protein
VFWAPFFGRAKARPKKPGFPLQVLGFANANPVGFPLQSLARAAAQNQLPELPKAISGAANCLRQLTAWPDFELPQKGLFAVNHPTPM